MTNLYSRLVSGEDQRTEALADLLERVLTDDRERDTPRFGDFVSRVLLADATDEPAKADLLGRINDPAVVLSVATQHRIVDGSIPDMVIFDGSDPLCVVEVKIGAPRGEDQLEGYGRWLAERANRKPALVLLTHVTSAPPGFTDRGNGNFGVELRSVAFWNTVAEWFAERRRLGGLCQDKSPAGSARWRRAPRQRAEEMDARRFGQDRVPVERCLRTGWIVRGSES